jgi:protein tyrosine phosphatase
MQAVVKFDSDAIFQRELHSVLLGWCNPQANSTNFELKKLFLVVEAIANGVLDKLDILSIELAWDKLQLSGRVGKEFPDEKLAKIKQVIYEKNITENLNSTEIGPELCRMFGVNTPVISYPRMFEEFKEKTASLLLGKKEQLNEEGKEYDIPFGPFPDVPLPLEDALYLTSSTGEKKYIHANYVGFKDSDHNLELIAVAQYPTHRGRFWGVCLKESISLIIDLTNPKDFLAKGKGFSDYCPSNEVYNEVYYANEEISVISQSIIPPLIEVEFLPEEFIADFSSYQVSDSSKDSTLLIKKIHFQSWPDKQGLPAQKIMALVKIIHEYEQEGQTKVLIHCIGGAGRTGTLAVCLYLWRLVEKTKMDPVKLLAMVEDIILKFRVQRGPAFVSTPEQLESIYRFVHLMIIQSPLRREKPSTREFRSKRDIRK